MLKTVPICALALALGGCVTPVTHGDTGAPSSIDYSLTPCFGFCPAFSLSVSDDGTGTYDGQAFVATRGEAGFMASDAEFAAFAHRLAPFKPQKSVNYGYENCDGPVATDSPSVSITWHDPGEDPVTLTWYMGCRQPVLVENSDALYTAWQELPVAELVGSDEERQNFGGFN